MGVMRSTMRSFHGISSWRRCYGMCRAAFYSAHGQGEGFPPIHLKHASYDAQLSAQFSIA